MAPGSTNLQSMDAIYQQAVVFVYNLAPQTTHTLNVTFQHIAPKGTLEMSCHYSGQYEAGMHLAITITARAGQTLTPYPTPAPPTTLAQGQGANQGACDPDIIVTIAQKIFSTADVALKEGETLTIRNTGDDQYTLTTKPDAGIRYTVVSANETEYVPFLHAGTFVVSSQEDPAMKLKVVVSSKQGTTCGFEPGPTVSFEASYPSETISDYFWSSPKVTIKEGQNLTLSNLSDQDLTFKSAPDASLAANVELDTNEHQVILFPDNGVYIITEIGPESPRSCRPVFYPHFC